MVNQKTELAMIISQRLAELRKTETIILSIRFDISVGFILGMLAVAKKG